MLDTSELRSGARCLYRKQTLIYQRTVTTNTHVYHVFKTPSGKEKRISQPAAQKDLWLEIEIEGAIASPTKE